MNGNSNNKDESQKDQDQSETTDVSYEKINLEMEQNRYQERPVFIDEDKDRRDKNRLRVEATSEEKERIDKNLEKLGDLFKGSDVCWQLDGALNISLIKGEYIGAHKDIDVTVEPDDLQKMQKHLFLRGYGLFLSSENYNDPTKKRMEWVPAERFKTAPDEQLMIAAIDEQGRLKPDESLDYIDVHLIKRNENGEPMGIYGASLPNEWYEQQWIDFHGRKIALSHPAKVSYFKIFGDRSYDKSDLQALADTGKLSETDVDNIESAINQGFKNRRNNTEAVINRVAGKISARMRERGVTKAFLDDPELSTQLETETGKQRILKLINAILDLNNRSAENIKKIAFEIFNFDAEENEKKQQISSLREKVKNLTELRKAREELEQHFN